VAPHFTPLSSLAGGLLIGLAASLLLIASGRVAGVSGAIGGLLTPKAGDRAWRVLFLSGLVAAGLLLVNVVPSAMTPTPRSLGWVAAAGVLVGVGARLGNGCTSGHGVCGISRLSPRSLVATATFMATGALTVALLRWLGLGS
jgi:uncharacterized membrane protein YedE/YeeE